MSAPSSEAPSPSQYATPLRSSRVCLNCRRKKKRCDKALPSCGRCTYSLEICQHEDDPPAAGRFGTPAPANFEAYTPYSAASQSSPGSPGLDPALESLMAQRPSSVWSTLNPSLFASLDSGETVHSFLFRSLSEMVGHRASVDQVVGYYFGSVNTWFTVVERASFQRRLEEMAVSPSAETALLILCMLLVIRTPGDHAALGMDDCLYLCVKAAFTLVQNTVSLSLPLLQAQLLVALYEYGHGLPQQAYASLGACMQMTRAFGWQRSVYWTEDRRQALPADLKMASILFWAVVYLDCLLSVSYPEQKYPLNWVGMDFSVPFPEAFDQYLSSTTTTTSTAAAAAAAAASSGFSSSGSAGSGQQGGGPADAKNDRIEDIVWPEANSAWYLSTFLHHAQGSNPLSGADRNSLSDAVTAHTISIMGMLWKYGNRSSTVNANFITLMKVNQPYLPAAMNARPAPPSELDKRAVETIGSVINSVYSVAQTMNSTPAPQRTGIVPPVGPFCMYYASMLLLSHGQNVLDDSQWLDKIKAFQQALRLYSRRWRIAVKYLASIDIALNTRLERYPSF